MWGIFFTQSRFNHATLENKKGGKQLFSSFVDFVNLELSYFTFATTALNASG